MPMEIVFTSDALIALLTLTILEIVLGIDNIIFISILAGKLPEDQQGKARQIGLGLAMLMRISKEMGRPGLCAQSQLPAHTY